MQGKTIVVTGGFGALGSAVAEAAAERGAIRRGARLAPAAPAGLAERLGPKALVARRGRSLVGRTRPKKAMAAVKAKFGRLDALLNIAGGFRWETVGRRGGAETWDRMFAMNLKTALNASRARASLSSRERRRPHRQCRRSGRHSRAPREWHAYAASKAARASADRKPRRRTEAQGRDRQRGAALDHRHARQPRTTCRTRISAAGSCRPILPPSCCSWPRTKPGRDRRADPGSGRV